MRQWEIIGGQNNKTTLGDVSDIATPTTPSPPNHSLPLPA